ncbi:MAG: rhomboid family intramembrane serine protease [Cyclobacteriaceae bacterium]|nr:rhomboid family intramembrane serine protease [Cyclobacteriaceae bacterium]MDH4297668.1 rhomboid family intramembrane serine protease [Cyclobacteriaceae bacterium]MDH5248743.1 rhomboid family intramembrane serine protease [Cyclobacteriaceae bacterium]
MLRLTPVVRSLIIINVLFFVAKIIAPTKDFGYCIGISFPNDLVTGFLSLWNVKTDCFKPYQLFTYMFVHGSFMHIFFNMLMLAFMGPMLEEYWGTKRFTIFYVVTGIGAGVFNILVNMFFGAGSFGIMMGASGAVYGVLMGIGMVFPDMEIQLLIPPIPIKAKYLVLVLGGLNFMLDSSGNVAHFAHLGGVVFAFILITIWKNQGRIY